jgi:hypothetical protein
MTLDEYIRIKAVISRTEFALCLMSKIIMTLVFTLVTTEDFS